MDKKEKNIWWGSPGRFDDKLDVRKICYLELLYRNKNMGEVLNILG